MLGWPTRYKLARPFMWEYSYKTNKRLKLAQLLGQPDVFLTWEAKMMSMLCCSSFMQWSSRHLESWPKRVTYLKYAIKISRKYLREEGVRLAQKVQVGPRIPVGIRL